MLFLAPPDNAIALLQGWAGSAHHDGHRPTRAVLGMARLNVTLILLTDGAAVSETWTDAWVANLPAARRLPVIWGAGGCGGLANVAAALDGATDAVVVARGALARGLVRLGARAGGRLAGVVLLGPMSAYRAAPAPVSELLLPTVPLPWPALVLPQIPRVDPDFGRARVYAAMWEAAFDTTATSDHGPTAAVRDFVAAHVPTATPLPSRGRPAIHAVS